ncbi:MAG: hypothetical protein JRL30_19280 [Deltaproteobacteria bacterium]|nr:hypothetical protein [Deltaproteobacteria bacterium]
MRRRVAPLKGIKILTTNPEERIGLYAIRYLGRAGARISSVAFGNGEDAPLGFLSRYANERIYLTKEDFPYALRDFLTRHASTYDLLNPIDVSTMLLVLDVCREAHLSCNFLMPKRESLVIADNKELLTQHAQKIGLSCPKSFWAIIERPIGNPSRDTVSCPPLKNCPVNIKKCTKSNRFRSFKNTFLDRVSVTLPSMTRTRD